VAEVWVDPDWYGRNRDEATEPCPPAGTPRVVPLAAGAALVGRPSTSRQIHPQVDCTPDTGVSRRHAQLLFDSDRWFVEDLGSTNGTFVAGAGVLPSDPIPSGERRELGDNDRVYVGAWTRIVVRRAMEHEAVR
jgi:pSer/pThr/pTyr-binding forkhead associated (FHA) protein